MGVYSKSLKRLRPYITREKAWSRKADKLRKSISRKVRRDDLRGVKGV